MKPIILCKRIYWRRFMVWRYRKKELNETTIETPDVKDKLRNALDVVDKIIAGGTLDRRDIELLIERIDVDKEGNAGNYFKIWFV